nr:two-component regulator propeller domain-containing protein [Alteromonas sp. BL110]
MRSTLINSMLLLLLALSGIYFNPAKAIEVSDLHFTELNKQHGLSDTAVLDIVEDDMGFIWLATSNGLNRYSGYDVKQYHPSDVDPNSLPSGYIQTLFVDSEGQLWVGTHSGLALYQPESDDFKVFNKDNSVIKTDLVTAISEAKNGDILFADRKFLYRFSREKSQIIVLTQVFKEESFIKVIFEEANRIWVGSNQFGAAIIDSETLEVHNASKVNPWGVSLDIRALHDITVINGNYWLATNEGLIVLASNGRILKRIKSDDLGVTEEVNSFSISVVGKDIWVGTYIGLFLLSDAAESSISADYRPDYLHLNSDIYSSTGIPSAIVFRVIEDRTGVVWAATFHRGAFKYHPEYASVHFQPVYNSERHSDDNYSTIWAFAENSDKALYLVSQQKGLGKISRETGSVSFFDFFEEMDPAVHYWDIEIDSQDNIWIASSVGLLVFKDTGDGLELVHEYFKGSFIDHIFKSNSAIWLQVLDGRVLSINTYSSSGQVQNNEVITGVITDQTKNILAIYEDNDNNIWFRAGEKLVIYSVKEDKVIRVLDSSNGINSLVYGVHETPSGLWLTTRSDGVIQLDKKSFALLNKQERDNQSGFITSTTAIENSIWYSDAKGVHKVHLPTLREADSIPNAQLEFNSLGEGAVIATSDKTIYFGGNKGFVKISKQAIGENDHVKRTFPPQLYQISVFGSLAKARQQQNENDKASSYLSLKENVTYEKQLALKHDETRFSISFGLVNPVYPDQVTYRYKLSGFESEWVYVDKERTAQFNNISFGNYTFSVQAKEPGKAWSESRNLKITIERPPWLHTVALVFYGLVALALFAFILRQYQIRKANQLAIKESEERLKLTLWSSGDELWDWDVYRGQVYRANTWGTLDFPQDDIRTTGAYDANIHPNDITRVKSALRAHLEGGSDFYELALPC